MREIRKIEPRIMPMQTKKRVAAYARVSADKDVNINSLSAQISYYSSFIQKRLDWEYAGVYADEPQSGTRDNRPEFQRLMNDCRNGKIDAVITKSISRFARNTVILLETIRELQGLEIDVYFERENIHSMNKDGELLLTILASFAQEESRSTSENMKWRIRNKFKDGRPSSTTIFGYKLIDGTFYVVPHEAEVVKMIFSDYLSGMGLNAIAKKLTATGISTKHGGNWREHTLEKMLTNVKYTGDLLLQKFYRADHLSKKICKNSGELPMFSVKNSHEPIVDRDTFEKVQAELAKRKQNNSQTRKTQTTYPYTGKIVCGICGKHYYRKNKYTGTKNENVVWVCYTKGKYGKALCPSQQIPEYVLKEIDVDFSEIKVPGANTLIVVAVDGKEKIKKWKHKTRSEGWSKEMRQNARKKQLEYIKRGKSECRHPQGK